MRVLLYVVHIYVVYMSQIKYFPATNPCFDDKQDDANTCFVVYMSENIEMSPIPKPII